MKQYENACHLSVIVLSLLLIIISGLVAAVCFLKWSKIKKDLFQAAAASQAPLIDEKEEAEAELLTKPPVIPEPPPPPPPMELGDIYFTVPGMDLIIFLPISEALLNSKSQKDKVQLFAPIWLEEIQSNKIYKKYSERNQKFEESKLRTKEEDAHEETEKPTSEEVVENDDDTKDNTKEMEEIENTENSRTESDQDC